MSPVRYLNERVRVISKKGSSWIIIMPSPIRRKIIINTMIIGIGTDQSIKGNSQTTFTGQSSADFRNAVLLKGKDNHLSDYKKDRLNQTL